MTRLFYLTLIAGLVWTMPCAEETFQAAPELIVSVGEIQTPENSDQVSIPIYLDNFSDAVAGFTLVVESDRPDILRFRAGGVDSSFQPTYWACNEFDEFNCYESTLVIDTSLGYDFITYEFVGFRDGGYSLAGSLIEDWEFVASRDLDGDSSRVKITALADVIGPPAIPDLDPQSGGVLLYLLAETSALPIDTPLITVGLTISNDPAETGFSDPAGYSLTIYTDTALDSTFWLCDQYDPLGIECLSYTKVEEPPYDNVTTEWFLRASWDSTNALSIDGFATVTYSCCELAGDANHDGKFGIADVLYNIEYVFIAGDSPACFDEADVNADGRISIEDIVYGIRRIFSAGPAPACGTSGR
jgi:hypothetical protein